MGGEYHFDVNFAVGGEFRSKSNLRTRKLLTPMRERFMEQHRTRKNATRRHISEWN